MDIDSFQALVQGLFVSDDVLSRLNVQITIRVPGSLKGWLGSRAKQDSCAAVMNEETQGGCEQVSHFDRDSLYFIQYDDLVCQLVHQAGISCACSEERFQKLNLCGEYDWRIPVLD